MLLVWGFVRALPALTFCLTSIKAYALAPILAGHSGLVGWLLGLLAFLPISRFPPSPKLQQNHLFPFGSGASNIEWPGETPSKLLSSFNAVKVMREPESHPQESGA